MVSLSSYSKWKLFFSVAGHLRSIDGFQGKSGIQGVLWSGRTTGHLSTGVQQHPLLWQIVKKSRPDVTIFVSERIESSFMRRYYIFVCDFNFWKRAPLGIWKYIQIVMNYVRWDIQLILIAVECVNQVYIFVCIFRDAKFADGSGRSRGWGSGGHDLDPFAQFLKSGKQFWWTGA